MSSSLLLAHWFPPCAPIVGRQKSPINRLYMTFPEFKSIKKWQFLGARAPPDSKKNGLPCQK